MTGNPASRRVPEGSHGIIGNKIAFRRHSSGEVFGAFSRFIAIDALVRRDPQFGGGHQRAVIVNDVLFSVVIVFRIVDLQMRECALRALKILAR